MDVGGEVDRNVTQRHTAQPQHAALPSQTHDWLPPLSRFGQRLRGCLGAGVAERTGRPPGLSQLHEFPLPSFTFALPISSNDYGLYGESSRVDSA